MNAQLNLQANDGFGLKRMIYTTKCAIMRKLEKGEDEKNGNRFEGKITIRNPNSIAAENLAHEGEIKRPRVGRVLLFLRQSRHGVPAGRLAEELGSYARCSKNGPQAQPKSWLASDHCGLAFRLERAVREENICMEACAI